MSRKRHFSICYTFIFKNFKFKMRKDDVGDFFNVKNRSLTSPIGQSHLKLVINIDHL